MVHPFRFRTRKKSISGWTLIAVCIYLQCQEAAAALARQEQTRDTALYADGRMGVPAHESDCNTRVKSHSAATNCYDYHLTTKGNYETHFTLSCILSSRDGQKLDRELRPQENLLIDLEHARWSLLRQHYHNRSHSLIWTSNSFVLHDKRVVNGDYDDLTINRYDGKLYHNYVQDKRETTIREQCQFGRTHKNNIR